MRIGDDDNSFNVYEITIILKCFHFNLYNLHSNPHNST